jgi:polysaccharide export outer membrane protein
MTAHGNDVVRRSTPAAARRRSSKTANLVAALLIGASLPACSASREPPIPEVADTAALPKTAYLIGPGDRLQIHVYGQQDLSKEYQVTAEGNLSVPLAGQVPTAGLSVVQLERELRDRLSEYLRNPQVTVAVQQFQQRFSILGQVQRPGAYPLDKRTTVLEALSIAGGLTDKAAPNRTRVIRRSGGQEVTLDVRLGDLMDGRDQSQDIPLQPNDKVVVPESFF